MTVAKPINCDYDFQGNKILNPAFNAGAIAISALSVDPRARSSHTGSQTASTISDLAAVVQLYSLDLFAVPAANLNLNSKKITSLANATSNSDAVNYGQVLGLVNGTKWLAPVLVATTANITLSGEQTLDGITTSASRVLVKNQSTASQNGVYLSAAGSWTRVTDLDTGASAASVSMFIERGTTQGDTQWICTTDPGSDVVGTNSLAFSQFGAAVSYTADESSLHLTGTTFSIKSTWVGQTSLTTLGTITTGTWTGTTIAVANGGTGATSAATARINLGATTKYSVDIGDGATLAYTVTHNLGTKDVVVDVRNNTGDVEEECHVTHPTTNTVVVTFNSAPGTNAYRVVVIG